MLVAYILNFTFILALRFVYQMDNMKRDLALEGKSQEEIEAIKEESRIQEFENVTDQQNVSLNFYGRWHWSTSYYELI